MLLSDGGGEPVLSRRSFVVKLAAGAAVASAVSSINRAQAMTSRTFREESTRPTGPANGETQIELLPEAPTAILPAALPAAPALSEVNLPQSVPPPWELLRPLALGSVVAHGWRVAGLTGVEDGSCVLSLENQRGRSHRVHLCRNDGRPHGLVYTKRLDLVVMNGGQGDLPTEEGLAQAVAEVAHVLAANEERRQLEPVVTALLPQAERVQLFAAAARLR
jgi:hypothetical protein